MNKKNVLEKEIRNNLIEIFCLWRELSINELQMKEVQDQLEAEQYFSVSEHIFFFMLD